MGLLVFHISAKEDASLIDDYYATGQLTIQKFLDI